MGRCHLGLESLDTSKTSTVDLDLYSPTSSQSTMASEKGVHRFPEVSELQVAELPLFLGLRKL